MFWPMTRNELVKMFKRNLLWIELGLLAAVLGLFYGALLLATQIAPDQMAAASLRETVVWPAALPGALALVGGGGLGGLLIIVLASVAVTQGYTGRTFALWLSQGTPRGVVLVARFVALLVGAVLIVATGLLAGAVVSGLITLALEGSLPVASLDWGQAALSVLRGAYALMPYAALTMLLAVLTRSMAGALGGGIAVALLGEAIVGQVLGLVGEGGQRIAQFLPSMMGRSLGNLGNAMVSGYTAPPAEMILLSPGAAAVGLAVYTVVLLALALVIFRRQDLSL